MRFGSETTLAVTWLLFGCATSGSSGSTAAATSNPSGDVSSAVPSGVEPAATEPPAGAEPVPEPEVASGTGGETVAPSPSPSSVEPSGGAPGAPGGAGGAPTVTPSATGGMTAVDTNAGASNEAGTTADAGSGGVANAGTGPVASDGGSAGSGETPPPTPRVLVFSATLDYRHESIPTAIAAFESLADERGWTLRASEAATDFADATLSEFNVVVFLHTSGDLFDAEQQASLQRFIQAGNGYVGVHSASTTEYDWPWYGELVGAYFSAHPDIQTATVNVENNAHPATANLPTPWVRTDEWYGFRTNPREAVTVLLTLDESTYSPGDGAMGPDHPIAWFHEYDGGRAFYTALGHTFESYAEPEVLAHLAGAVEWAATP